MDVNPDAEMVTTFRRTMRRVGHATDDGVREILTDVLDLVSNCQACPDGCPSCSRNEADCECYEHDHPRHRAENTIRYLVELIESGKTDPAMRGRVLADGWVI